MRPGPPAEYNLKDYELLCPDMENVPEGVLRLGLLEVDQKKREGRIPSLSSVKRKKRTERENRLLQVFRMPKKKLSTLVSLLLIPNATGNLFVPTTRNEVRKSNVFSHVSLSVHRKRGQRSPCLVMWTCSNLGILNPTPTHLLVEPLRLGGPWPHSHSDLFKLVHYVAYTSIGKWIVELRLKDLLLLTFVA